ncbi:MAG: hypothetical protein MI748_14820 [Opitutales bacterium]|nr:hypothetical protein [Opitutales bacterium]
MILQRSEMDARQVASIINEIQEEVKIQQETEEKPPPVKKQFVMMVSDPDGVLEDKDLTGWVLQIPEDDSPYVTEERLVRGAYEFNTTPKGRRYPVKTIGECCEVVSARILKEQNVWVKTKEPVLICRTQNDIPWDEKKEKFGEE